VGPVSQPPLPLRIFSSRQLENEERSIRLVSSLFDLAGNPGRVGVGGRKSDWEGYKIYIDMIHFENLCHRGREILK